jgi:MoaA/NifB/PqqE/SkfB family radical SAM enzyme
VAGLRINGGEPLLNRDFLLITDELRKRGMIFHELISNIYHMTPEIADGILAQGHAPEIYVSFDGLGHHDWLRGIPGAERRTLENIAMLKSKGFFVHVHYCVWRASLDAIRPTILRLRELGVDRLRITTIEPSVRWVADAPEQSLDPKEWLEYLCGLLPWWYENRIDMSLDVWSYWKNDRGSRRVSIVPDMHRDCEREDRIAGASS